MKKVVVHNQAQMRFVLIQPSISWPILCPSKLNLGFLLPAVPTVPPGNVQAEAVNSTTVRFTWNAPSPQFINGINQGYKVCISLLPSSGQRQKCSPINAFLPQSPQFDVAVVFSL